MQQAVFNVNRERNNNLFCRSYKNDWGVFSFHSQIELYFIDEGEMEVWVGDRYKLLKAGEMSVALSFEPHTYHTPVSSRSSVLIIPQYLCEEFVEETKNKRCTNPFICDRNVVKTIRSYYEKIKSEDTNKIERVGFIYATLGLVLKHVFLENDSKPNNADLSSKLLFYINEQYKSGITPADVAAHFGYSPSYLSRYFKSCFRINMNKYITTLKLKNVLMLMHEKKYTVTHCALESGFASMRTFYNAFCKEFGCTPKEYFNTTK